MTKALQKTAAREVRAALALDWRGSVSEKIGGGDRSPSLREGVTSDVERVIIEEMDEQNIRAAIDRHWAASAAGDQAGEHEIYHDDVVCEYPQSGEIIYGRRNLQALRSHHRDKPSEFTVRRVVEKVSSG